MTNFPLHVMADTAQSMMENGADVSTVQNALTDLGCAFGMRNTDCFALPTGVFLTVVDQAGFTSTVLRSIKHRSFHLDRLNRIEAVIQTAHGRTIADTYRLLLEAMEAPNYSILLTTLAGGLAAGGFCLFFKGGLWDAGLAFLLGVLWMLLKVFLDKFMLQDVLISLIGGFFCLFSSGLVPFLGVNFHAAYVGIGTLMLLVPGLAVVNALRDLAAGELVTGVSRLAEVVLIGVGIAVGGAIGFESASALTRFL